MKKKYRLLYGIYYQRIDGVMVKHKEGDIVELSDRQAISFKDMFEPMEGPVILDKEVEVLPESKLKVIHEGFGRYNVIVTKTGKKINDNPLTKKEAYSLLEGGDSESDEQREEENRGDTEKEPTEIETKTSRDPKVDTPKTVERSRHIPTRRRAKPEPNQPKTYSRKKVDSGK